MTDIEYLKKYLDPSKLEEGIKQLEQGIPVQYIVGNVDFYGSFIEVNPNVLIPRFETEELVEKTISYIQEYFDKPIDILEIGTGSGCISIALFKNLKQVTIDAADISKEALEVAIKNAKNNQATIHFFESDLFSNVSKTYDVLISNPPYISYQEEIMDLVKKNEPHLALYADHDGLYCYEEMMKHASSYLNKKAMIAFEIGHKQGKALKDLAETYFPDSFYKVEKDLQGRDRFFFLFLR